MAGIMVWVQGMTGRSYSIRWTDPITGKTRSKSAKTYNRAEAEQQAADLQYDLNMGIQAEKDCRLTESVEQWVNGPLKLLGTDTQVNGAQCVRRFAQYVGNKPLREIDGDKIERFIVLLREDSLADETVKKYLTWLNIFLKWAVDRRLIREIPKYRRPKFEKGGQRAKIARAAKLTRDDFKRMIAACPNHGYKLLVTLAWECGLRRCEAMRVDCAHIDMTFDPPRLYIPKNKSLDKSQYVFLTPEVLAAIQAAYPDGLPKSGQLCAGVKERREYVSFEVGKAFRVANVQASLHDLRRNFGTRWAALVPAQVLQRLMRHSSIKVTMEYYADVELAASDAIKRFTVLAG